MPAAISRLVDVRTTPVAERLQAIDDLVAPRRTPWLRLRPAF